MTRFPSPSMLILVGGLAWQAVSAAPVRADFEVDLRHALEVHREASSLEQQTVALEMLREITRRYPDRWLGHFWAAYEETQIAMFQQRAGGKTDPSAYLERAQQHLSAAERLNTSPSERERSSCAALQSLIYGFRQRMDGASANDWMTRAQESIQRAAAIDPDNPVVLVMLGTDLVNRGHDESDPLLLWAARHLLRLAQDQTETVEDLSHTTYFNAEWIQFWLPGVEETLAQLNTTSR